MLSRRMLLILTFAVILPIVGCTTPTLTPTPTFTPTNIPQPISVTITVPTYGEQVPWRPFIEGTISDPEAALWVIVHPMAVSEYFVQPSVTMREGGKWKVQGYVGGMDTGVDEHFEIMAIVNPKQSLKEGDRLGEWPEAQGKSNVIEVIRKAESVTPSLEPTNTPSASLLPTVTQLSDSRLIFGGGNLSVGYDMGVNTSGGLTNWVTKKDGAICMAYPSGQSWGAVFITVGKPVQPPRPSQDLSKYQKLSLELRGEIGGDSVLVGLKDNTDPDDGTEIKMPTLGLTTGWKTFEIPLSEFKTADLHNLYVITEFVFEQIPETVCFRNIQYLP